MTDPDGELAARGTLGRVVSFDGDRLIVRGLGGERHYPVPNLTDVWWCPPRLGLPGALCLKMFGAEPVLVKFRRRQAKAMTQIMNAIQVCRARAC